MGQNQQNSPGGGVGTGPQRGQTDNLGKARAGPQQAKQPQKGTLEQTGMGQGQGSGGGKGNNTT